MRVPDPHARRSVLASRRGPSNGDLDAEFQVYLDQMHQAFLRNGLGIADGQDRNRFTIVKKELQDSKVAYLKSLNTSSGIWLTAKELDGLPMESFFSLEIGDGKNASKVFLPFKKPHLERAKHFVKSETTRRQIYVGHDSRCFPRLKRAIVLRDEAARLQGYPKSRPSRTRAKMAESSDFQFVYRRYEREVDTYCEIGTKLVTGPQMS
jgi:metallopeptidase MepB